MIWFNKVYLKHILTHPIMLTVVLLLLIYLLPVKF